MDGEVWHLVEGRRDDGAPAIFRIRELDPRLDLPRIFVVEMPYPITEMSKLPNAAAYRRLGQFEEQWLVPACAATGYELVGLKIEEGSFFLYMYGAADPNEVMQRLAPFDAALGFYDDEDPSWVEYATLKDLLDQAKAMPADSARPSEPALAEPSDADTTAEERPEREPTVVRTRAATITGIPPGPRPAAPAKPDVAATKTTTRIGKPKAAAKKAPAQKAAAKTPAAKKSAAKTPAPKKPAAKKFAAKKPAAKNSTPKKSAATKPAAKKPPAKARAARKPAAKKRR